MARSKQWRTGQTFVQNPTSFGVASHLRSPELAAIHELGPFREDKPLQRGCAELTLRNCRASNVEKP